MRPLFEDIAIAIAFFGAVFAFGILIITVASWL